MEQKDISITFCDDCMEVMDMDGAYEDNIRVRRRECIYYSSTIFTVGFLIGLFIWCYIIISSMDKLEEH